MDQYSRRIIGFGVHAEKVDGAALCLMFNHAIWGQRTLPKHLSTDHDQLFLFERWRANLRILDVAEIKSMPYVPPSHPFVERLIGTTARMFGPDIVLDLHRSRKQAVRFPELLQPSSHTFSTGGTNT